LSEAWVTQVTARLSRRVQVPCRVSAGLAGPSALLPDRPQGDADALLATLEERALAGGPLLVGLTALDLAVPVFTFVFGRAEPGGRAAVVSLARLDPVFYGLPADPEHLMERTVEEVVHELGHLGGLAHCRDAACVMSFAGSVEKVDVRGTRFCAPCAKRLPRWLAGG
jgi:archaemetzincin